MLNETRYYKLNYALHNGGIVPLVVFSSLAFGALGIYFLLILLFNDSTSAFFFTDNILLMFGFGIFFLVAFSVLMLLLTKMMHGIFNYFNLTYDSDALEKVDKIKKGLYIPLILFGTFLFTTFINGVICSHTKYNENTLEMFSKYMYFFKNAGTIGIPVCFGAIIANELSLDILDLIIYKVGKPSYRHQRKYSSMIN